MNHSFQKFVLLGAMALGMISTVQAHGNHQTNNIVSPTAAITQNISNYQQQVQNHLEQTLNDNVNKHLLTQTAHINIKIVASGKTTKSTLPKIEQTNVTANELEPSLSENMMMRTDGACFINLTFDDYGNIPKLALHEGDILSITSLKNDTQKSMAQEFIALHEYYHCEFTAMENPVLTPGQSSSFNQQINNVFKEQVSAAALQRVSYIDTLNENFADTAAAMNLIMKYGLDNPDFKFVIESLKTQRHAKYFQSEYDSHFTHFSLEKVLEPQNLDKLKTLKTLIDTNPSNESQKQFSQLALEIANNGTNQIIVNNPKMEDSMLSATSLAFSVFKNLNTLIHFNSTSPEFRKTQTSFNMWAPGVSRGLSQNIAENLLTNINLKEKQFYQPNGGLGPDSAELFSFIEEQINTKVSKSDNNKVIQAMKNIEIFKQHIHQQNNISTFDQKPSELSKDEALDKIKQIRTTFIQQQKQKQIL